jgi:hypothetical protein
MKNHVDDPVQEQQTGRSSTAAHTPGPWAIGRITVGMCSDADVVQPNGDLVAIVAGGNWLPDTIPDEVVSANARLIAAAPDLLAALKHAQEAMAWHGGCDFEAADGKRAEDVIAAAIAKAEGNQ